MILAALHLTAAVTPPDYPKPAPTKSDEPFAKQFSAAKAASDGYGTGFVTFVLLQAGERPTDPAVANGVRWLKANPRESGRWFARLLNSDEAYDIGNAGTARVGVERGRGKSREVTGAVTALRPKNR